MYSATNEPNKEYHAIEEDMHLKYSDFTLLAYKGNC
jgi:hypothetical protein